MAAHGSLGDPGLPIPTVYIEAIWSVGPGGKVIRPLCWFSAGKADLLPRGGLRGHQEGHGAPGGQGTKTSPGLISEKVRVRAEAAPITCHKKYSGQVGKPSEARSSASLKEERHPKPSRQLKDTERGQKAPCKTAD